MVGVNLIFFVVNWSLFFDLGIKICVEFGNKLYVDKVLFFNIDMKVGGLYWWGREVLVGIRLWCVICDVVFVVINWEVCCSNCGSSCWLDMVRNGIGLWFFMILLI